MVKNIKFFFQLKSHDLNQRLYAFNVISKHLGHLQPSLLSEDLMVIFFVCSHIVFKYICPITIIFAGERPEHKHQ